MAQNLVPAITSVGLGLETIAVGKGPAGLMEAVTERLDENPVTIVRAKQNAF